MKIVVLDGYTLNPGDLSWDGLGNFDLTVYDRTAPELVFERSVGADILLTNKTVLNREMLKKLKNLKYVGVLATGYNVVDTNEASKLGIVVTNIPAYGTNSVAQMTFALILELCTYVQKHSDSVMNGKWTRSIDFTYTEYPLTELSNKTLGLIGFGNIGKKVYEIASAFGMKVVAFNNTPSDEHPQRKNFRWMDLNDLLRESDIVSLHCPLTADTWGLINSETLRMMKKSAFLINTARGPIVVDSDLAAALNSDVIAGAGLDVLSNEPPSEDNPLLKAKNCIITPHIAWATIEARSRLMKTAVENVEAFLSGSPVNVVSELTQNTLTGSVS